MNFDITNRIVCAAIIALLGIFAGDGCALTPGEHFLPSPGVDSRHAAPVLRVVSADSQAAGVVCESLARTGAFARIDCSGDAPADLELLMETAVVDSSHDYSRNAGWSALTLTTALRVSTSARAVFRFRMGPMGGPYSEVKYASRGRIGMWGVLPVYTGFIATIAGTWLNDYRLPENLRRECLGPGSPMDSPACRDYREFLQDAYSKFKFEFWSAVRELPRGKYAQFKSTAARCAKRDHESRFCPY